MIEAVIFDLDGTLIHLPINYEKLFHEIKKILKTDNVRPLLETITKVDEKRKKEIFQVWNAIELETLPNVTLIAEGKAIYEKFSEKPKALVTMQGKPLVQAALKNFDLSFDAIATREDGFDRTKQLRLVQQKLNLEFINILFVGNKDYDQIAAKNVGCRFQKVEE